MDHPINRRSALKQFATTAAVIGAASSMTPGLLGQEQANHEAPKKLKGNVRHSACRWCYGSIPLEEFCKAAREIGLQGIDLMDPKDFPVLKKHGLECSMVSGVPGGITKGLNREENHEEIYKFFERMIPVTADNGFMNIICFSGNRNGISDEEGLENCAAGLKRIVPLAEKYKVNVIMELLNSKRDHKDYMCDRSSWGVKLCKKVGSERFKLLYDIYHMQIMEGDVVATIRENHQYFGHYHTGGVPGRNEIDETQELYYPRIIKAIVDSGFKGFLAQEFMPKRDPLTSLRQAVEICDV